MPQNLFHLPTGSVLVVWCLSLALGFGLVTDYASAPGSSGTPPPTRPTVHGLAAPDQEGELLFFAHAMCPCTVASLAEFDRLLTRHPRAPKTRIILWTDPGQREVFEASRTRDRAEAVARAEIVEDPLGKIAERFGVETSGHILLFDSEGVLKFSGGITASRGHEGGNRNLSLLEAQLRDSGAARSDAPVYGCPLQEEELQS